jgi:hypothetical protein
MARPTDHADYGIRTLQLTPPCSGRDVWELQIKLIGWGSGSDNDSIGNVYEPVKVNGTFDLSTAHAVMRFQRTVGLNVTGIVDAATYQALDREPALYPVLIHEARCACITGANDGPIFCRCNDHPLNGKCAGFGNARFNGKFLVQGTSAGDPGKTLGDGTDISGETLDLYDMQEYQGIDKAVTWAVRALMRRANVARIGISSGYRCWEDNYHHCDDIRWRHRRLTFHFGKAIEFYLDMPGKCTDKGDDPNKAPCPDCASVRHIALSKCGFQERWQEPDRVSVAEGSKNVPGPANPFAVHVNTVRRLNRQVDDYVRSFLDSVSPLYKGQPNLCYPIDLGDGIDPKAAPSERYFRNTESSMGGWFPMGASRMWHGGVHLYAAAGTPVYAIADGAVIACRITEAGDAKPYGSRNFVLIQHEYNKKKYYGLYCHLNPQPEASVLDPVKSTRWRTQLFMQEKDHIQALGPCPFFEASVVGTKKSLKPKPQQGLAPGDNAQTMGGDVDPKTVMDYPPANSTLIALAMPAGLFAFTKLDNRDLAKKVPADKAAAGKLASGDVLALKTPITVRAGEKIGEIGPLAKDPVTSKLGTFVHVELFSADAFLTGVGWTQVNVGSVDNLADRKKLVANLLRSNLLSRPPDSVLLPADLTEEQDVYRELLRTVILKVASAWSADWTSVLAAPDCLAAVPELSDLGKAFSDYSWWNDAKSSGADLPAGLSVYHYHPIAALLAMAYA